MILLVRGADAWYQCPVCEQPHRVLVQGSGAWQGNGDLDRPTFSPSVKVSSPGDVPPGFTVHCHVFIRDGQVEVLNDSPRFGGQTIPLPPLPQWLIDSVAAQ